MHDTASRNVPSLPPVVFGLQSEHYTGSSAKSPRSPPLPLSHLPLSLSTPPALQLRLSSTAMRILGPHCPFSHTTRIGTHIFRDSDAAGEYLKHLSFAGQRQDSGMAPAAKKPVIWVLSQAAVFSAIGEGQIPVPSACSCYRGRPGDVPLVNWCGTALSGLTLHAVSARPAREDNRVPGLCASRQTTCRQHAPDD
ncbi:hypothetical protein K466DRAFT_606010 [Polyporus arcularius HHB13444]|uniref:Uncharacterized protein n=1 Tax=Polyporus arcularius HHB13444 TaxID=1314778 RepID=A0A5C3NSS9_9APHY|nr:hypothetical protein K466DRAFT_606010 [Polyporus arcularius HHB13444]